MKALLILIFLTTVFGSTSFAQCLNATPTYSNVNCFGGLDGTITLNPTNGQAPYTYTWNAGTITVNGAYTIQGLAAGVYNVTVEDNLGCDMNVNFTISQPAALSINTSITSNYNGADISCHSSCDGEAIVTVSGGSGAFAFLWSNGSTNSSIVGVCAGVHYVTVSDANGCIATDSITVTAPNILSVNLPSYNNVTCNGSCSGSATVAGVGGLGIYTYLWPASAGNQTTASVSNLCAGDYCVTVTDINGCQASRCITIPPLTSSISASIVTSGQAYCNGATTDSLTVSTMAGSGPYTYFWTPGFQTTGTIANLAAGTYCVTVTNSAGCIWRSCETITNPLLLTLSGINIVPATCNTTCDGSLSFVPSGGSPPYAFSIDGGALTGTSVYSNLCVGQHIVTIEDAAGCIHTDSILIGASDSINIQITNGIISGSKKYGITYQNSPQLIQTISSYPNQTNYNWLPATGLSCTTCPNPTVAPVTTPTQYILNANHNTLGCTSSDTIIIYPHLTDTVRIELAPDSSVSYCSNYPPFFSGATFSALGSLSHGAITYGLLGCFDYTSNGRTQGIDTILWIGCTTVNIGTLPVYICDTTVIYLTTASCVWPGDTDNDGIANNFDLLPIGQHYGTGGLTRTNATINYNCQPSLNWGTSVLGMPTVDLKHVDTDGNAIINSNDTNAIILNWTQTHLRNSSIFLTGIDLYVDTIITTPGAMVRLPIILGSTTVPNGYGIAFTVNYDPTGMDTNTVSIDFDNSWLGTINSDMIGIQKDFYHQGQIEAALTRINQIPVTGSGAIAHINFTIKDDVLPRSPFLRLAFNITNIRFIDPFGTIIPVTGVPTQIVVTNGFSSTEAIFSKQENPLTVSPNPTTGQIQIQSLVEKIETISIYNLTGTLLYKKEAINALNTTLDLKTLPKGVYIANVISEKGMQSVRILKN